MELMGKTFTQNGIKWIKVAKMIEFDSKRVKFEVFDVSNASHVKMTSTSNLKKV